MEGCNQGLAVAEGLYPEIVQISRAGQLDDSERRDRLLHDRPDAEGDRDHLQIDAPGVPDHRHHARSAHRWYRYQVLRPVEPSISVR